jgi:TRAP-type uncharacterized transport system fused permease subunit
VALAAYAGAGIAKADPMKTGVNAFKLALAGFIVPYIYVYNLIFLGVNAEFWPMVQAVARRFSAFSCWRHPLRDSSWPT